MIVRMLRNPAAAFGCRLREGDEGALDDDLGRRLVASRIAEAMGDFAVPAGPAAIVVPVQAVPGPPAISEAEPPAIAADTPQPPQPRRRSGRKPTERE